MRATLDQIAKVIGSSKRSVERLAQRQGWAYEERPVRGGKKRLYPLHTLPADIREAVTRHLAARSEPAEPAAPSPAPPAAPDPDSNPVPAPFTPAAPAARPPTASARREKARAERALRRWQAIAPILEGRIAGRAAIEAHARALGHSAAALYRWLADYRRGGMDALTDPPRRDAGTARVLISPAFERATAALPADTRAALDPGYMVFGDVSPADIPVLRPDGSAGWARLIVWQDAATNMIHVTGFLAEKGRGVRREHVAAAFSAMCEEAPWGVAKRLYLDRGSEFSRELMLGAWRELARFTQGRFLGAWRDDALDDVGRIWRTEPYRPRAKLIESGFAQLLWFFGWHPHFAGSDRLTKKTRTLGRPTEPTTLADLKQTVARVVAFYHATPQDGHLAGVSPAEAMAEHLSRGFEKVSIEAEALMLAFSEPTTRVVRQGVVTIEGIPFHHEVLYQWHGETLPVRWARHRPEAAFVFHPRTHALLCTALPVPVFGFTDAEGARQARAFEAAAKRAVAVLRGQVAWLDPLKLMEPVAELARVEAVIAQAEAQARRVRLSAEAEAMARGYQEAAAAALSRAAARGEDGAACPAPPDGGLRGAGGAAGAGGG